MDTDDKKKMAHRAHHNLAGCNTGVTEQDMNTKRIPSILIGMAAAVLLAAVNTASAQSTDPDLTVCDGVDECTAPDNACSELGFHIALTNFVPAAASDDGASSYTYAICSPSAGTCTGTARPGENCLDHSFCQRKGGTTDPTATCSRGCAVDTFHGLSHFDVTFPALGSQCVSETTAVTGSCTAKDNTPTDDHTAAVGAFVLGDGACDASPNSVAKCDAADLNPGDCIEMTIHIPGETTDPGLSNAIVVDKASSSCTATCLQGPSCTTCVGPPPEDDACLTRTIGFWGTHPLIAGRYDPVTVCGVVVDGQSAGACSTSEALCTNSNDRKDNPQYLQLVAQLTAAQLNLNATDALGDGSCSSWSYDGKTIRTWIASCETNYCSANKSQISESMCIEALTAFNESQDTGFDVTPPPFDRPGPANPMQCQSSRGNRKYVGSGASSGLSCPAAP